MLDYNQLEVFQLFLNMLMLVLTFKIKYTSIDICCCIVYLIWLHLNNLMLLINIITNLYISNNYNARNRNRLIKWYKKYRLDSYEINNVKYKNNFIRSTKSKGISYRKLYAMS